MATFLDVILIIFLFSIFAVIHSFLASIEFKRLIKQKLGNLIAFYRFFYNLVSLFTFGIFIFISPKPHQIVYDIPYPFDLFIYSLQILSLIGIFWTFKFTNWGEFLGINQLKRYFKNNYNEELDENYTLRIDGPYKISRHPIYFFTILFLALRPYMSLFYFTLVILIIVYFYIGSFFEEKKLEQIFGQDYIEYKYQVSRIFPIKWIVKRLI